MRSSGILMHISSLPSKYGIGCFCHKAYEFVDKLCEMGQKYWQILPLNITGFADSPYQSFSTNAGNPYFISIEEFIKQNFITQTEVEDMDFGNSEEVDYGKLYISKYKILKKAFLNSEFANSKERNEFVEYNDWVLDFSFFMALKFYFNGRAWHEWDFAIKIREETALKNYKEKLNDEIEFHLFLQYHFYKQWFALKNYANLKGIEIIGDIPIYVSLDSVECWVKPYLFQLDENKNPIYVAGCPKDAFSPLGQLWGNPLYNWEYHKNTSYKWWVQRIKNSSVLYDYVRIDHFRGFDEYYAIKYGEKTALNGTWKKGPSYELFETLKKELGDLKIIAEDLGYINDSVKNLLKFTGFKGMKVLEFAFDSREESDYLPHNYEVNSVVYTGTHDNAPLKSWFKELDEADKALALNYLDTKEHENIHWDFINLAMSSVSEFCIIPIQDYLGSAVRYNTPSTLSGNWKYRIQDSEITDELVKKIYNLTDKNNRLWNI